MTEILIKLARETEDGNEVGILTELLAVNMDRCAGCGDFLFPKGYPCPDCAVSDEDARVA